MRAGPETGRSRGRGIRLPGSRSRRGRAPSAIGIRSPAARCRRCRAVGRPRHRRSGGRPRPPGCPRPRGRRALRAGARRPARRVARRPGPRAARARDNRHSLPEPSPGKVGAGRKRSKPLDQFLRLTEHTDICGAVNTRIASREPAWDGNQFTARIDAHPATSGRLGAPSSCLRNGAWALETANGARRGPGFTRERSQVRNPPRPSSEAPASAGVSSSSDVSAETSAGGVWPTVVPNGAQSWPSTSAFNRSLSPSSRRIAWA